MSVIASCEWKSPLPALHRERAYEVARNVGSRLQARERVEEAARRTLSQTGYPETFRWQPKSIANGFSGIALLHKQLHLVSGDPCWEESAKHHVCLALADAEGRRASDPSLFSGLAGVGFAAYSILKESDGLVSLDTLDHDLCERMAKEINGLSDGRSGVSTATFDVISGLSGVGAYLLLRRSSSKCRSTLDKLINAAIALLDEVDGVPRWHTPGRLMVDTAMRQRYPQGTLNCGLAHGLPGILAFLSISMLANVSADAIRPALRRSSMWLAENRCDDQWGMNWPNAVAVTRSDRSPMTAEKTVSGPSRAAWCYGAPGVARALWLAGSALEDEGLQEIAVSALKAVARRPISERAIDSPTFCHGVAGLLHIMLRFSNEERGALFAEEVQRLTDQILLQWEPDSYLGFCSLEPGNRRVDQPGLLDGAAGVAIALLAAATDEPPLWDRLFLLA